MVPTYAFTREDLGLLPKMNFKKKEKIKKSKIKDSTKSKLNSRVWLSTVPPFTRSMFYPKLSLDEEKVLGIIFISDSRWGYMSHEEASPHILLFTASLSLFGFWSGYICWYWGFPLAITGSTATRKSHHWSLSIIGRKVLLLHFWNKEKEREQLNFKPYHYLSNLHFGVS